jgi:hypothetical protein
MKFDATKHDKGVAGLEILLAIITMIFAIGMLVMIFIIMGTKLMDVDGLDKTAIDAINSTTVSIAGVVDWFDIILIISAMVVLILLTVIIISAIKGVSGQGGV